MCLVVRCLEHSSALDVVDVWRGTIGKRQELRETFSYFFPPSRSLSIEPRLLSDWLLVVLFFISVLFESEQITCVIDNFLH